MEEPSPTPGSGTTLIPLSRRNTEGEVYRRAPEVERQIREALALRPDALRERAAISDQGSPDYVKEECLVYLIRHHRRAGERQLVNDLTEALLRRCVGVVNSHLWRLGGEFARDGFNDVVEQLFERILDLDSDRGDFLQVRFWVALDRFAGTAFKKQLRQYRAAKKKEPLSALPGYHGEDEDAVRTAQPLDQADVTSPAADQALEEDELLRERCERVQVALGRLGEPQRTAFLLRHHAGWPIEDQDPTVRTISRHFGKTPRTIRNWLNQAEEVLEKWRGEQR